MLHIKLYPYTVSQTKCCSQRKWMKQELNSQRRHRPSFQGKALLIIMIILIINVYFLLSVNFYKWEKWWAVGAKLYITRLCTKLHPEQHVKCYIGRVLMKICICFFYRGYQLALFYRTGSIVPNFCCIILECL